MAVGAVVTAVCVNVLKSLARKMGLRLMKKKTTWIWILKLIIEERAMTKIIAVTACPSGVAIPIWRQRRWKVPRKRKAGKESRNPGVNWSGK